MDFKNEVERIIKDMRLEKLNQSVERVKYNAYSNEASAYSARKLGLYNTIVKENDLI